MIYLVSIAFTACFVMYSRYQFQERAGRSVGRWHPWGWCMRALFASAWILPRPALADALLAAAASILVFELGINKVALGKSWLYVGATARTDRVLGRRKWLLFVWLLVAAAAYKYAAPWLREMVNKLINYLS